MAKVEQAIAIAIRGIRKLEYDCTQLSKIAASQGPILQSRLSGKLTDLEAAKRVLASHEANLSGLRRQIEALSRPDAAETRKRQSHQNTLAELSRRRLEKDFSLQDAINGVRVLLAERRSLTAKMREVAPLIDLTMGIDGFDTARFDALLNSLPDDLVEQSEQWVSWFLGNPANTSPRYVDNETLTLPESLACAHVYHHGDTAQVTIEVAERYFPSPHIRRSIDVNAEIEASRDQN
jgi:hypothetical protein